MKTVELRTVDGRCIARHVEMACSFRSRCLGLLRRTRIPDQQGLLLIPGGSIHTLGMRFSIDVVFLNRQMRVLQLVEYVPPWRVVMAPSGTARVLELAGGRIATTRLTSGTYLIVHSVPTDPNEQPTLRQPALRVVPCKRSSLRFSLRLPIDRRCAGPAKAPCNAGVKVVRTLPPYLRALDFRARMRRNVET